MEVVSVARRRRGRGGYKHTKNAHEPMKVDKSEAYAAASSRLAKPSAPHTVKPSAPIRFQNPMCQPRTLGAGVYHVVCVSSMNNQLDTMKPTPPTTLAV